MRLQFPHNFNKGEVMKKPTYKGYITEQELKAFIEQRCAEITDYLTQPDVDDINYNVNEVIKHLNETIKLITKKKI